MSPRHPARAKGAQHLTAAGHVRALGSLPQAGTRSTLRLGRASRSPSPRRRARRAPRLQPAPPFLGPLHLTKYLHEMAIRLPRFNEN